MKVHASDGVPRHARNLRWQRCATCAALLPFALGVVLLGTSAQSARAQTASTPGDFTPGYNLDTQSPSGTQPNINDLKGDIDDILHDSSLSDSEKQTAINNLVNSQVGGGGFGTCAEQLDPLLLGLDSASVATELAGTIAEAVGAVAIISEIPGVILQGVGTGLHLAGTVTTGIQNSLPNCSNEFTGTVETWANFAAKQGISAFDGAITLGTPTQAYYDGITLGGGSLAGAGNGGAQATTGDVDAIAIGNGAFAENANDTALGTGARATGGNATALGANSTASGENATAVGGNSTASGDNSTAVGYNTTTGGENDVAVGTNNNTGTGGNNSVLGNGIKIINSGIDNVAIGTGHQIDGSHNTAIGDPIQIIGSGNFVGGNGSSVTGANNQLTGNFSTVTGDRNFAGGNGVTIDGDRNVAIGENANTGTDNNDAVSLGSQSSATQVFATAVGSHANATGARSTAIGDFATANQGSASALGNGSTASGSHASAFGSESLANALDSTAVGYFAQATGQSATALGGGAGSTAAANASGDFAIAIGGGDTNGASATATNAIAMGQTSSAAAENSTAIGYNTTVAAAHTNSSAIGTGATTTYDNQMMFGTSTQTYTMPGITSTLSRSRQVGPLDVTTSDADGNLASDGGAVFTALSELQAGVAMSFALENPELQGRESFGVAANWGKFNDSQALGFAAIGVLSRDTFGGGERLAVSGGFAVSTAEKTYFGRNGGTQYGGRAGGQLTW